MTSPVVVTVYGGVARLVHKPRGVPVVIVDYDDEELGPQIERWQAGDEIQEDLACPSCLGNMRVRDKSMYANAEDGMMPCRHCEGEGVLAPDDEEYAYALEALIKEVS